MVRRRTAFYFQPRAIETAPRGSDIARRGTRSLWQSGEAEKLQTPIESMIDAPLPLHSADHAPACGHSASTQGWRHRHPDHLFYMTRTPSDPAASFDTEIAVLAVRRVADR